MIELEGDLFQKSLFFKETEVVVFQGNRYQIFSRVKQVL